MLKKFLKKNDQEESSFLDSHHKNNQPKKYEKTIYLVLTNMENKPQYPLQHQLTIGREMGNIVINDESISPRHVTFFLKEGVLSLVDHGSIKGTFINGSKISSGRNIIVEESDKMTVGQLEVEFLVKQYLAQEDDKTNTQMSSLDMERDELIDEDDISDDENEGLMSDHEKTDPHIDLSKIGLQKKMNSKKKIKDESTMTNMKNYVEKKLTPSNAVLRIIAFILDIILTYSLFVVISPFQEFQESIVLIKNEISRLMGMSWEQFFQLIFSKVPFLETLYLEMINILDFNESHLQGIYLFFLLKMIGVIFVGTSFSQFALGIRVYPQGPISRLTGFIRTLLEVLTTPFLIFDFPSILSRKTLKEVLSFTTLTSPSLLKSIIGLFIYTPLLAVFFIAAPLIQGGEFISSYLVDPVVIDQSSTLSDDSQERETSSFFDFQVPSFFKEFLLTPSFQFISSEEKTSVTPHFYIFSKELNKSMKFELLHHVDLKELFLVGLKSHYFLHQKFPALYDFVFESNENDVVFRKGESKNIKGHDQFIQEMISFIQLSLSLDFENVIDVVQNTTPFLGSLVQFKSSLFGYFQSQELKKMSFRRVGDHVLAQMTFSDHQLFLPLNKRRSGLYKISFEGGGDSEALANQFTDEFLPMMSWSTSSKDKKRHTEGEPYTPFSLIDDVSTNQLSLLFDFSQFSQDELLSQNRSLFQYYFDTSKEIVSIDNSYLLENWKDQINQITRIIELAPVQDLPLPDKESEPFLQEENQQRDGAETLVQSDSAQLSNEVTRPDFKAELLNQFNGLKDAVELKNLSYFGLDETESKNEVGVDAENEKDLLVEKNHQH